MGWSELVAGDGGTLSPAGYALVVGVGLLAGVVNTLAGGGSLVTLPALIFLGLPASVANGTNRVGSVLQSSTATWRFHREGVLDAAVARRHLVPTVLGSVVGACLSLTLEEEAFRRVIALVMVLVLAVVVLQPRRFLEGREGRPWGHPGLRTGVLFAVAVYGGFIQAGVGCFLLVTLAVFEGLDLVRANGVKVLLVAVFTLPPLAIFIATGNFWWQPALALAAGSAAGGWVGTRLTVSWGPPLVRAVLVVVVLVSAVRLLGWG